MSRLAYFEWSAPGDDLDLVSDADRNDPALWAMANPGMNIRISEEHIALESDGALGPREFCVERLGIGAWPSTTVGQRGKITPDAWASCTDEKSRRTGPVCFAFDVTPDRSSATISVAGRRKDGLPHVETVDLKSGTKWVAQRVMDLVERHDPIGVLWAKGSPAASLVAGIEELGVTTTPVSAEDHAKACGVLYDAVTDDLLRHLGTTELAVAVQGARTKPYGESWLWSRQSSEINIAPLVGATLALWGLLTVTPDKPRKFDLADYRLSAL